MNIYIRDIDWFINKIKNNEYFSYSRWNDGEWYCFQKKEGQNCDGHKYFHKLADYLLIALKNKNNLIESNNERYIFESGLWWDKIENLENIYKSNNLKVNFLRNDLIHKIKLNPKKWIDMINTISSRFTVIIGHSYVKKYTKLKYKEFIDIPEKNCFLYSNVIISKIRKILNIHKNKNIVFIFMASMTTNYIIDYFFNECKDKHFMLDFGSSIDIFIEDNIIDNRRRTPAKGIRRDNILKLYPKDWRKFY